MSQSHGNNHSMFQVTQIHIILILILALKFRKSDRLA